MQLRNHLGQGLGDYGKLWPIITIVGPILLLAVVLWAIVRNRTSRRSYQRTEQATKDLYAEEDQREKRRNTH